MADSQYLLVSTQRQIAISANFEGNYAKVEN